METVIHTHSSAKKQLFIALTLGLIYFSMLAVGSYFSGSISLGANAGHMLMHSGVLLIALLASTIAAKAPNERFNSGYHRVESLGALINGFILLSVALFIVFEALGRHDHHGHSHEVDSSLMGIIAFAGIILHSISAFVLRKARRESLNAHAAFLHIIFDVSISIATLVAAGLMHAGFPESIDTILALSIAIVIGISALKLLIKSSQQLLDAIPSHINYKQVVDSLKEIEHVVDVHNVVIRSQGQGAVLSAHLVLSASCVHSNHWIECRKHAQEMLEEKFGINYSILQMEIGEEHAKSCQHHSHD